MSTLPIVASTYRQFPGQVVAKFPDAVGVINQLANFTPPQEARVKPLRADKVKVARRQRLGREECGRRRRSTRSPPRDSSRPGRPTTPTAATTRPRCATRPGKFSQGYTVAVAVGHAEPRRGRVGEEHAWRRRAADRRHRLRLAQAPRSTSIPPPAVAPPSTASTTTTTTVGPTPSTTTTTIAAADGRHPVRARRSRRPAARWSAVPK